MGKIMFWDGEASANPCPECGGKLVVRTNHKNRSQFLRCESYPDCRLTETIPETWRMRALGAKTLPGFE